MSEQVTIIMPVYNPGKYLRPCLESLLAQTMGEFRIIAIDDSSTDNSWEVLQEYAAKDARILSLKNPYNIGAARTRNIGIQIAQGEYVVILDADDYFEPDYLACLWFACKEYDLDVAVCDIYMHDERTDKEVVAGMPSIRFKSITDKVFLWKDIPNNIFQLFLPAPFLKMYKRSFLEKNSLQFQSLQHSNDVAFFCKTLICAQRMMHISKYLVHYRFNTGNQISTSRGKNPMCTYNAMAEVYEFLTSVNAFEKVRSSFFALVVNNVYHTMRFLDVKTKSGYVDFWQKKGYTSLGMASLCRYDFVSYAMFYKWKAFLTGSPEVSMQEYNLAIAYKEACNRFFCEAKKRGLRVTHWGYGKLGSKFALQSIECGYPLVEIYDNDQEKWNSSQFIPVISYENRNSDIDLIVITNASFEKEICKTIKEKGEVIPIFDFSSYINFGLSFSDCCIKAY